MGVNPFGNGGRGGRRATGEPVRAGDLAADARALRRDGRTHEAAGYLERALEVSPHKDNWRQSLCGLLAELGRVKELAAHAQILAERADEVATDRLLVVARLAVKAGQVEAGRALLDRAVGDPPQPGPAVVARRRLPGYLPPIEEGLLERTARRVADAPTGAPVEPVSATPFRAGQGQVVDGVVRHILRVADREVRLVQKTLVGPAPREILLHRDGVLPEAGDRWRSVTVHHVGEASPDRWHLLLEDLGDVEGLSTPRQIVDAARSLAELHAATLGARERLAHHGWLFGGEDLERVWAVPPVRAVTALPEAVLPEPLRTRAADVLTRFHDATPELDALATALPSTLLHGDTGLENVVERTAPDGGRRMVWFDWDSVQVGPVGADLAQLLLGRALRHYARRADPTVVERAVDAYAADLAVHGVSGEAVRAGYRLGATRRMLRLKFRSLRNLPAGVTSRDAPGVSAEKHRLVLEDLALLFDEADRLLRSV